MTHKDPTLVSKDETIVEIGSGDSSTKRYIHTVPVNCPIKHGAQVLS